MSRALGGSAPGLVALMGGTFDPVHIGHLRSAWEAARLLDATVRLMPAPVPPHRPQPLASAEHRLRMLEIAVAAVPVLQVDDRELRRSGPSYSVDTLIELRAELGPDRPLALIVGADAFAALPSWSRWLQLFELAHIVVLNRPGAASMLDWPDSLRAEVARRHCDAPAHLHTVPAGQVFALAVTPLAISATAIRESFVRGETPHWLVPAEVLAYIESERLYL
jgi:nicotinate-nucleotide adenylyltransferase